MSRATSASLYGSKPPVDESRMPNRRAPRAYGLRSESAPTGWYRSGVPARQRRNGPVVSNRPDPEVAREAAIAARAAAMDEDDTPVRPLRPVVDYAAERALVGRIRMADID